MSTLINKLSHTAASRHSSVLTAIGRGWLLIGGLALVWPALAQQGAEFVEIETLPATVAMDEQTPLLSLGAILAGLCLWGILRVYQRAQVLSSPERMRDMRRQLLAQIAGLDDDYARGRLGPQRYRRKREDSKRRALDLTIRLHDKKDGPA